MKIKTIKKLEPQFTVDIEVADTHSYQLENGCVSHNSTSKLQLLEEGAHLPPYAFYLRWMQHRSDDPKLDMLEAAGYPVRRDLKSYPGTSIVGFPTQMAIAKMGRPDLIVTSGQVTPEQQYLYLQLLEKYYIRGVETDGVTPLVDTGNQVSYTLKYDPTKVGYDEFVEMMGKYQATIRCCSVMPQTDDTAYEYQPEEAISMGRFKYIVENLTDPDVQQDFDLEALQCASGACPL